MQNPVTKSLFHRETAGQTGIADGAPGRSVDGFDLATRPFLCLMDAISSDMCPVPPLYARMLDVLAFHERIKRTL